ncbi:hypothetical protein [Larkinella sp.]
MAKTEKASLPTGWAAVRSETPKTARDSVYDKVQRAERKHS